MAEAMVPHLLSQILDILRREWCCASEYERELEKLKVLIESIVQFLKKANSKEAINEELKASMKRARKFLYDSQDAIDDLMRHESNHQWEGLLPNLYRQLFRGRFASEAKAIREMVNAYKTTLETISVLDPSGELSADPGPSSSACHLPSSIAFSEENDNQLVGIDSARKQLVQWLTEDHSMSKVIFVHGPQGVGKTSLVGAVLRDQSVRKHFKYYVWIKDYELVEASADVLMEANVEMWKLTKKANIQDQVKLKQAFERMGKDKCLYTWVLVLDDANKAHVIESLWSCLDPYHPSVLITTRDSSLESCAKTLASASRTSTDTPMVQSDGAPPTPPKSFFGLLKLNRVSPKRTYGFHNFQHVSLSMDHPFELFSREMFDKEGCPSELNEVSKSILKKCEGLPLAILATSKLLKHNQHSRNGNPSNVDWENWNGRLGEELLSRGHESRLIRRMITLRMDHIHDVHSCLFYLSIFPLDCPIRCSTLMRLWMAERFAMQEGCKTDQEIADENLKKLLERNFIQEVEKTSYGRVRTCRVHNLQHEIIMKKAKDDEFAMIVAGQKERWPETIWRLSFHSSPHKSASADVSQMDSEADGTRVKRLRSLFVFKEVYPKSMEELLGQADRLNVLHLEPSTLNSFPKGIPSLKYLRYLKLTGTRVETIPKGIRHLAFLETLDLKGTRLRELPDGILELKELRHLLVYRSDRSPAANTITKYGVKVPPKLGDLKSLRKLCLIKLDRVKKSKLSGMVHGKLSLLEELGKLEDLRRLGISELRSEDMGPLCSSIEKLQQLNALHLIAASGERLDLSKVDERKAPRSLQRVHLTGRLGTLPNWILSHISLTKLVLKACQLSGDLLQHLRELPCLRHLELEQAFDASEMMFETGKFPQLCFLGLDRFDKLASLNVEEGALPTLEKLSLARCQLLTTVPKDITRPKALKCLELYDMPEQFMMAVKGNKEVHKRMKVVSKDWNNETVVEVIPFSAGRARSPSTPPPCKK